MRRWPSSIPRPLPIGGLYPHPFAGLDAQATIDAIMEYDAKRRKKLLDSVEATGVTPTYNESIFTNRADFTTHSTSTSETSLLAGTGSIQPLIPANYFLGTAAAGRGIRVKASGILGTTSTPTIIFQLRLGETAGPTFLSGTSIGVTAAITTASGVSNQYWSLEFDLICTVQGMGTGNATLSGSGYVFSPGGFASPFIYPLLPTTPPTATWTATFNAAVTQYLNLSATWSASSASNTITCKKLIVEAFG